MFFTAQICSSLHCVAAFFLASRVRYFSLKEKWYLSMYVEMITTCLVLGELPGADKNMTQSQLGQHTSWPIVR